ncbi:MAG TPA: zinc ribbon domain-containing protein [Solirubrobacteraceae bacterium]|nr:zinc ribbon domain-containing protein [Solirubrobacteraceae bacterium]
MSSLTPLPPEQPTCEHCGSPLVADQRYCLSCGQPVSPVRLAFLDVLQREGDVQAVTPAALPVAYDSGPPRDPVGPPWLRRYAPLFAVGAVLLLAMLIGLLVGHWVSGKNSSGQQTIRIVGLSALPTADAASATPESEAAKTSSKSSGVEAGKEAPKEEKTSPAEEKKELKEAAAEETKHVAPPKPVKVSSSKISKLEHTHGRKHEEEVNKLGDQPIEVP